MPESVRVVFWVAADHRDEGQQNQADNEERLGRGEDELAFAVVSVLCQRHFPVLNGVRT